MVQKGIIMINEKLVTFFLTFVYLASIANSTVFPILQTRPRASDDSPYSEKGHEKSIATIQV